MPLIRPPHAEPSLDPFDDGIGEITRDGETYGHVLTSRRQVWSLLSPLRRQWCIQYAVVWADGSREPETDDSAPFIATNQMKSGFLVVFSEDPARSGRYDFAWLVTDERRTMRAPSNDLDRIESGGHTYESLVEAIAWWRIGSPGGRMFLADAATAALVLGAESSATAQLAVLSADENAFDVDHLIDQAIDDLDLHAALAEDNERIACRFICREYLRGELSARELARWAHQQFHHESAHDDVNLLAEIDDEFDLADAISVRQTRWLDNKTRLIAMRIVRL